MKHNDRKKFLNESDFKSFLVEVRKNWNILLQRMIFWSCVGILAGYITFQYNSTTQMQPVLDSVNATLAGGLSRVNREFATLNHDIRFLTHYRTITNCIEYPSPDNIKEAANFFSFFIESNTMYDQIRWLDETGKERIRVRLVNGAAVVVPDNQLQDKTERYYSSKILNLKRDEIYYSPLDLDVIGDDIETPYKPILRIAYPVFDSAGSRKGAIMLNYLGDTILDYLRQIQAVPFLHLEMLNPEGYWILNTHKPDLEWGFMFNESEKRLAVISPKAWEALVEGKKEIVTTPEGMWKFASASPFLEAGYKWILVIHLMPARLHKISEQSLFLGVLITLITWIISFLIVSSLTLSKLQRERDYQLLMKQSTELQETNHSLEESLTSLRLAQNEIIRVGRLSSLGMMVAGIAHELNTPLGASILILSSLKNALIDMKCLDKDSHDLFQEGFEILTKNIERAIILITDFKRLAGDRAVLERRSFKLQDLVNTLLTTSLYKLKKEVSDLKITVEPNIELDSYPGILGQILENLLFNALHHAYRGTIPGQIILNAFTRNDQICIEVIDFGCGMDEATQNKIFDPFFTTNRTGGGLGLGLYLVYQFITEQMGGNIWVESEVGKGSTFVILLPFIAPEQESEGI